MSVCVCVCVRVRVRVRVCVCVCLLPLCETSFVITVTYWLWNVKHGLLKMIKPFLPTCDFSSYFNTTTTKWYIATPSYKKCLSNNIISRDNGNNNIVIRIKQEIQLRLSCKLTSIVMERIHDTNTTLRYFIWNGSHCLQSVYSYI